jgi:hypothetical protein
MMPLRPGRNYDPEEDGVPTSHELRQLILELTRQLYQPYAEDHAARYGDAIRAHAAACARARKPGELDPSPPVLDLSELAPIWTALVQDAKAKVLDVLALDVDPET